MKQFDTILHLANDTALPDYLMIKQFDCPRHIMAVSHDTEPAFNLLQGVLGKEGCHTEKLNIPVDDVNTCRRRLEKVVTSLPEGRHAVNLTGGSRVMFAALFEIARRHGLPAVLLDTKAKAMHWLDEEGLSEPLRPVFREATGFIRLAGYDVDAEAPAEHLRVANERRDAAMACWQYRDHIGIWSKSLRNQAAKPGLPFRDGPRKIKGVEVSAVLKKESDGSKGILHIGEHAFTLKPWKDLASFIAGGWYRDAVLANLMTLKHKGVILDVALGVNPSPSAKNPKGHLPAMDILYTDGINLTVVDCYLRWSDNRVIRQVVRQVRQLAGDFGRGILAVAYENEKAPPKSGPTVTILSGPAAVSHPEHFL